VPLTSRLPMPHSETCISYIVPNGSSVNWPLLLLNPCAKRWPTDSPRDTRPKIRLSATHRCNTSTCPAPGSACIRDCICRSYPSDRRAGCNGSSGTPPIASGAGPVSSPNYGRAANGRSTICTAGHGPRCNGARRGDSAAARDSRPARHRTATSHGCCAPRDGSAANRPT
jgi:hypothetical protein